MRTKMIQNFLTLCACLVLAGCPDHSDYEVQGYIDAEFTYIASSVSGHLISLNVTRGQAVAVGDPLFQLDPQPEIADLNKTKAQVETAQQNLANLMQGSRETVIQGITAQLQQAQAQLELASLSLKRNQELYRTKVVAKAMLDDAQTNYRAAEKKVEEITANLDEAKMGARKHLLLAQTATVTGEQATLARQQWLLGQKEKTAAVAGHVYDTFYRIGEYVPAGQPVLALLTPDNIKLIFYLPEPILSQFHAGSRVQFTCDGCKGATNATIYYISSKAEYTPPIIYSENTRKNLVYRVEARLTAEDAQKFKAGQPVDVTLLRTKEQRS